MNLNEMLRIARRSPFEAARNHYTQLAMFTPIYGMKTKMKNVPQGPRLFDLMMAKQMSQPKRQPVQPQVRPVKPKPVLAATSTPFTPAASGQGMGGFGYDLGGYSSLPAAPVYL